MYLLLFFDILNNLNPIYFEAHQSFLCFNDRNGHSIAETNDGFVSGVLTICGIRSNMRRIMQCIKLQYNFKLK